jgi:hypothetical protein
MLPAELILQIITSSILAGSYPPNICEFYKHPRPALVINWLWDYFEVTQVNQERIVKRTKKWELID